MKSKVQFDLNGLNQAVISAKIAFTSDVRDKVATTFREAFGYESILATCCRVGYESFRDDEGIEKTMSTIEIRPTRTTAEGCQELATLLSDLHLENLSLAIAREIAFRKRTGLGNITYFYGQPVADVVRDYSVEDSAEPTLVGQSLK